MKYVCYLCDYNTDNQANFNRHNKTKKHIELYKKKAVNEKILTAPHSTSRHLTAPETNSNTVAPKIIKCKYCDINFSRPSSLLRHYNVCKDKN